MASRKRAAWSSSACRLAVRQRPDKLSWLSGRFSCCECIEPGSIFFRVCIINIVYAHTLRSTLHNCSRSHESATFTKITDVIRPDNALILLHAIPTFFPRLSTFDLGSQATHGGAPQSLCLCRFTRCCLFSGCEKVNTLAGVTRDEKIFFYRRLLLEFQSVIARVHRPTRCQDHV